MIPAGQNSKWMVRFFLRRDFSWEAGFVERARVPISRREYEDLEARLREGGRRARAIGEMRAEMAAYVPPRFMGYLYAIVPGTCEASPLITDGERMHHVPHNGLWTGMEEKVNRVLCVRRDRWPLIKPESLRDPTRETIFPKHFVLHDTERGEAGLYLWTERFDYLRAPLSWRDFEA